MNIQPALQIRGDKIVRVHSLPTDGKCSGAAAPPQFPSVCRESGKSWCWERISERNRLFPCQKPTKKLIFRAYSVFAAGEAYFDNLRPESRLKTGHVRECSFSLGHPVSKSNPLPCRENICTQFHVLASVIPCWERFPGFYSKIRFSFGFGA